jgi:hypothetical protein
MLTQAEVAQELTWCGLGEMTGPGDNPREFEAYGDGRLNVVHVLEDGTTVFLDSDDNELHRGPMQDTEQIIMLADEFGHYAAC